MKILNPLKTAYTAIKLHKVRASLTILGLFIFLGCANHQYQTYLLTGNDYFQKGQYQLAFINYNKAIELDPFYSDAYNNRGAVYSDLKKYELAIADYNQAIKLDPSFSEAYYNRGNTYLNLKNIEKAKEDAKKAAELGNKELLNLLKENGYL